MVKSMSARIGLPFYFFNGSTSIKKRDEAIRKFLSAANGPAIFAVTLLTGSVGITLTAASHVNLMEPCIDPT